MDIGKIDGVNEPFMNQPRQEDQRRRQVGEVRSGDRVNISPEAKRAADIARFVSLAKEIPDIRPDKVAQAKARLESETSQDPNVNRAVAQRLLNTLL